MVSESDEAASTGASLWLVQRLVDVRRFLPPLVRDEVFFFFVLPEPFFPFFLLEFFFFPFFDFDFFEVDFFLDFFFDLDAAADTEAETSDPDSDAAA